MKFLMFQSNDIIGTNDIPLHSPSYECDFLSLVKSLVGKFNFVSVDEVSEVEKLANVTHKYNYSLPFAKLVIGPKMNHSVCSF